MTSFQKKARIKVGNIPGTRPSLYNNQLLVSTGIPSLDNVIGGGLAVGSVIVIEEDRFGSYAKLMLKYFTAEGIVSQQGVYLCSRQESPQQLLQELPDPIATISRDEVRAQASSQRQTSGSKPTMADESGDEKMKIAWRYQNQPKVDTSKLSAIQFGHHYDLTKVMNEKNIDSKKVFLSSNQDEGNDVQNEINPLKNKSYLRLLQDVQLKIEEFKTLQSAGQKNILRIGVQSLGSPLWCENGGVKPSGEGFDHSLTQFLVSLRAKLRSNLAVAMVTVPAYLFTDTAYLRRVERLSDYVVRLESFAGSDKNPAFKEYHGLLHLLRLPRLNTLLPAQPETADLAFKLKRKKFTIERLHLPPDIGEPAGNEEKSSKTACGTSDKLSF